MNSCLCGTLSTYTKAVTLATLAGNIGQSPATQVTHPRLNQPSYSCSDIATHSHGSHSQIRATLTILRITGSILICHEHISHTSVNLAGTGTVVTEKAVW